MSRQTLAWECTSKLAVSHTLRRPSVRAVADPSPIILPSAKAGAQHPSYFAVSPRMLSSFSWRLLIIAECLFTCFMVFACQAAFSVSSIMKIQLTLPAFATPGLFFITETKKKGWVFKMTLISQPPYGTNIFSSFWLNFLAIKWKNTQK